MTEKDNQCAIKPKAAPLSRGEESPVRDKKSPDVQVHEEEPEGANHPT